MFVPMMCEQEVAFGSPDMHASVFVIVYLFAELVVAQRSVHTFPCTAARLYL